MAKVKSSKLKRKIRIRKYGIYYKQVLITDFIEHREVFNELGLSNSPSYKDRWEMFIDIMITSVKRSINL